MKTILNKIKNFPYYDLVFSLLIVAIGLCMILFPSAAIRIVSVLCGLLLCAFAIYRLLLLFTARGHSLYFLILLFVNLLTLLGALALIFFSRAAVGVIGFVVGLVLIVDALKRLYLILPLGTNGARALWIPLALCALTLIFGVFLLFAPNVVAGLTSILLGAALIFEGVQNAVFFFLERRHERRPKDDYIETNFEDKG